MRTKKIIVLTFFLIFPTLAETDKQVKKFEDLFIWKISDELKLTPQEELTVSTYIKDSNKKKTATNEELESLYKKLSRDPNESDRLSTYLKIKKVQKSQYTLTLEELERIRKSLGLKRLGQYLELKRDLAEKIKSIWIQNEKKGTGKLPPPKVIEEK